MKLEQTLGMYRPAVAQEERQQAYFVVGNLESLSASPLYTGKLKIVDLPASGMQMHLHEGETKQASSVMDYARNKTLISSYDAAMGDYYAQKLNLSRSDKKISKK